MARYVDSVVAICGSVNEAGDTWIRVDGSTRALVVTGWENYLIHNGLFYAVMHTAMNVADNGFMDFVIKASEEHSVHALKARWWTTGDALLEARAGVELANEDVVGVLQPVNMKFGAGGSLSARFWGDPDVINPGVVAFTQYIPGGTHPWRYGGFHEIAYEWVLPSGGDVLIRVNNISGATAHMSLQVNVFEDGEKIKDRW